MEASTKQRGGITVKNPMSTSVSVSRDGTLWQAYALYGDETKVKIKWQGFIIQVDMKVVEGRAHATVKVCGNTIFDTEEHALEAPVIKDMRAQSALLSYAIVKEARASVALDGQTQSEQEETK